MTNEEIFSVLDKVFDNMTKTAQEGEKLPGLVLYNEFVFFVKQAYAISESFVKYWLATNKIALRIGESFAGADRFLYYLDKKETK